MQGNFAWNDRARALGGVAKVGVVVTAFTGCHPRTHVVHGADACVLPCARDASGSFDGAPDAPVDGLIPDAAIADAAMTDAALADAAVTDAALADAAVTDAAPGDAAQADAAADGGMPGSGHVLYPEGLLHSPITSDIAAHLASIAAAPAQARVFAKVGDSMTATTDFLTCFASGPYDLGAHGELSTTLAYYLAGNAGGTSPYARTSEAALGGWTTADVLAGAPSPLDQELAAITPRVAVTQLGTNDLRYGRTVDDFGSDLWTIVDRELGQGAIPILSTIPAIHGDPESNTHVPLFNRVIRAIAQGRGVPLVDFHLALAALPNDGIGSDGIHPVASPAGACILTAAGLAYGYNVRNLITLEALDRTRRALAGEALDADAPRRQGAGSHADPFLGSLPLTDLADTRGGESTFATYPACGLTATGREIVYRLDLSAQTAIDAVVADRGTVDVDVAILTGALDPAACVASGDHGASATVGPGPVYVIVDSHTAAAEGEFILVVEPQ